LAIELDSVVDKRGVVPIFYRQGLTGDQSPFAEELLMTDRSNLRPSEVVRLATEQFNAGDLDSGPSFVAPDAVDHSVVDGTVPGSREHLEAWERRRSAFRNAAPDLTVTVERTIEVGDTLARLLTVRGTLNGRAFEVPSMDMVRVRDGKIVEHWAVAAPFE
jgi:predicted SnoaL-like aldol condensation-catalyzing enzyme